MSPQSKPYLRNVGRKKKIMVCEMKTKQTLLCRVVAEREKFLCIFLLLFVVRDKSLLEFFVLHIGNPK